MEIGGYDIIIETNNPKGLASQIMWFLGWEEGIIEKDSGKGFENDFFYYKDKKSKAFWDDCGAPETGEDNMVHFIMREDHITIVADERISTLIREKFCKGK